MIDGLNSDVISSPSWFSWSEMLGMVLMMYDGSCLKAVMKQEYAVWGSVFAIIEKTFILFMGSSVLFWTYSIVYL